MRRRLISSSSRRGVWLAWLLLLLLLLVERLQRLGSLFQQLRKNREYK